MLKLWGSGFCLCRNALRSGLPVFISSQRSIPKTFSTLNCFSQQLFKKYNPSQTVKLFNRSQIKCESTIAKAEAGQKVGSNAQGKIGVWLICCTGMVYLTIIYGGVTRLTESGLSMVTWRFTYEKFPSTEEEWENEFKKYQEYPEFKILKKDITLEEFKRIWQTEYLHRNLGRSVGVLFMIPAVSFWFRGWFLPKMKKRVVVFAALIAVQGLMGWYMVQSGLEDRFHKETDVPRVSQYRLASHLALALALYTGLFWTALEVLFPPQTPATVTAGLAKIRKLTHTCKGLVFLTALSGALVAGLDAGLIYNSFPKMGEKWIPDDILALSPSWKNFTENPTTAQFDHRILAITTFSLIMATWLMSRKHVLPGRGKLAMNMFALAACCQVVLGISTLVHNVPISLAVSHQSMSVMLLTAAIWAAHELKKWPEDGG